MTGEVANAAEFDDVLLRVCWAKAANASKPLHHGFPQDVGEDGRLRPEVISITDLKKRGFSLQRRSKFRLGDANAQVAERYNRTQGQHFCVGFVDISRNNIVSLHTSLAKQAFTATDDGGKEGLHPAHTSVMFTSDVQPEEQRKLRKELCAQFSVAKPLQDLLDQ